MSCPYYKYKSGTLFGYYWCVKNDREVSNSEYDKYCRGYNYDSCPIYKHEESSGCFLTTIVHKILGKEDNDEVLENFRSFRDNVLQQNERFFNILKIYDIIGPILVSCIELDENKDKISNFIYKYNLLPLNDKINNKEYDHAVNIYQCMTMGLIEYYGLMPVYLKAKDYNYEFDPKNAGHGRCLKRVMTK